MDYKKDMEKHMEDKTVHYVTKAFKIFAMIVLGILLFLLANYVLMCLWNWLMPELFGLPTIGYWKALGILVLAKIIFGFGGGDGSSSKKKSYAKSKKHFRPFEKCRPMRRDFSDWELYDEFWKEQGEQAFKDYVDKHKNKENDI
ncbi:MAG: hypothetical protein ABJX94_07755 [Flavobacteriaceae bacterium]